MYDGAAGFVLLGIGAGGRFEIGLGSCGLFLLFGSSFVGILGRGRPVDGGGRCALE